MPARSLRTATTLKPASVNRRVPARSCPAPSSTISRPPGASRARRGCRDGAVGVEAVGAAVERQARIVVAHFRRRARRCRRARYKAGSKRSGRTGRCSAVGDIAGDESAARRRARCRSALARAQRRARPALMSVPMPVAFGNSCSSASSSAPEPVPMSRMRKLLQPQAAASTRNRAPLRRRSRFPAAAPARPASTSSGRLQNSLRPRMRATGSRLRRRAAQRRDRVDSRAPRAARSRLRDQLRARSSCSACASRMRASASGVVDAGGAEAVRHQAHAPRRPMAPALQPGNEPHCAPSAASNSA